MILRKTLAIASAIAMATALMLTGCSAPASASVAPSESAAATTAPADSAAPADTATTPALSGKLEISGSTSMQELAEQLAEGFMAKNPGVTVNVQGGGSSVGIQNVTDGLSDIGNASRALKDEEKSAGLVEYTIAQDGVAAIVNPANGVSDLTAEQIMKIFKGEITNWKDVGGKDAKIIVITREASSGTREAFTKLFNVIEKGADGKETVVITDKALECNDNGSMMTNVAGKPDAIGYCSVGSLNDTVKPLKVEGVDATKENIIANTYKYWRPFVMATKGDAKDLAKSFLDFVYGPDGGAIVAKKYIPVAAK